MSKERNIATQKMLQAEGLYKGKLDGVIGPATRRALELHNKQQYQPLPRQRPSGVALAGSAEAAGGPAPGMAARGQVVPGPGAMSPMPPMPDSSAFINDPNPTYGGPNPATAVGIRQALGALLGQPPQPSSPPNFAGEADYPPDFDRQFAPGPEPMDSGALEDAIQQQALGRLLSQAVPRR